MSHKHKCIAIIKWSILCITTIKWSIESKLEDALALFNEIALIFWICESSTPQAYI